MTVVEAEAVTRAYGAVAAVREVHLGVTGGEIIGITGPSGGGKSTLLRLLGGMERPDHGELRYAGRPAWAKRRVVYPRPGYVMPIFQDPFAGLDSRWPIWRSVTEALDGDRRATARRWLDRAALGRVALDARPGELSGGQCQRVAVVRALARGPALIVADEPTARQDLITATAIAHLLREAADEGTAVVVVGHDIAWLDTLADRTVRMDQGRLT